MKAAIYARKSTDQTAVVDEQKSVIRQVEHARHYAERKGWTVDETCIFVDDGISGAEFANRPGFLRLMNALKPRPPFQVLVMSEESRLGRESIETAYALKQLVTAGVRVFFYLEDRERTLDSPIEKIMMQLTAFTDEMERDKARQRTYDAMQRKARAGHVTGGRVFGYDNHRIAAGHVERRINAVEAAIVRRIFRMCADGTGLTSIAKTLNAESAPCPRSQQGRPNGWAPSSVRELLYRELYRGVVVWNRTRKRDQWGQHKQRKRAENEWMRIDAPELRILTDEEWNAAHDRLAGARQRYLRVNKGRILGRPPAVGTKYLLSGLLTCGVCGSSLEARTRSHGRRRVAFYGCAAHHRRGGNVCSNSLEIPMADADGAVLSLLERVMLDPGVVETAIEEAFGRIAATLSTDRTEGVQREIRHLETELGRLTEAVAAGAQLSTVLDAIRAREAKVASLRAQVRAAEAASTFDAEAVRPALRARLADWRQLLRKHVEQSRQLVQRLIVGRLVMTPDKDDRGRFYRFHGEGTFSKLLAGIGPQKVASPTGFEPVF